MTLIISEILSTLNQNQHSFGITLYEKASLEEIESFEVKKGINLPDDFKIFYSFCNGFESEEDMFRIIPLEEIFENGNDRYKVGQKDFHFAEYMIYCDMWTLNISQEYPNSYSIYNKADTLITLTNSFAEFLAVFLKGGVFEGLYHWRQEIEQKNNPSIK